MNREDRPEILIVGAGSVGIFLATRFTGVANVRLVLRPGASAHWSGEVRIQGIEDSSFTIPATELSELGCIEPETWVLVACKAYQLRDCLTELQPHEPSRVILAQNGIGILEEARTVLPSARLGRLVCWSGVNRIEANVVEWAGRGQSLDWVAEDPDLQSEFDRVLKRSGFPSRTSASVAEAEWRKALLNLPLNALTALAGVTNGEALHRPDLRQRLDRLLDEAIAVAKAQGVRVETGDRERVIEAIETVSKNYNSTYQDLTAGRPTEIPWLNGAVVKLGRKYGVLTPENERIVEEVAVRERLTHERNQQAEKKK